MFVALVAGEGDPAAIGRPYRTAIGDLCRQLLELVASDMGDEYPGTLLSFVIERNLVAVRRERRARRVGNRQERFGPLNGGTRRQLRQVVESLIDQPTCNRQQTGRDAPDDITTCTAARRICLRI